MYTRTCIFLQIYILGTHIDASSLGQIFAPKELLVVNQPIAVVIKPQQHAVVNDKIRIAS